MLYIYSVGDGHPSGKDEKTKITVLKIIPKCTV